MFCEDMANYAANKALRKLGVKIEKKIEANEAVIAETTRNISNPRENGWHVTRNTKVTLEEGVTYLFVLDGEQYVRQCKRISETCLYIGNGAYGYETLDEGSQIGGKDTGEPFCLVVGSGGGMMSFETEGSHTYSLWTTTETETIHPIFDKYLPGVCLPVVDLVGIEPSYDTPLPEEIANVARSAMQNGNPLIVRANATFDSSPVVRTFIADFINSGGMRGLLFNTNHIISEDFGGSDNLYFLTTD